MNTRNIYIQIVEAILKYENKKDYINDILKYIESYLCNLLRYKNNVYIFKNDTYIFKCSLYNEYIKRLIDNEDFKKIYNSELNIFELLFILNFINQNEEYDKIPNKYVIKEYSESLEIDIYSLYMFIQKSLYLSKENIDFETIIKNYNEDINVNHPRAKKLNKKRLKNVLINIFGDEYIKDDYLIGFSFKEEYNRASFQEILNHLN